MDDSSATSEFPAEGSHVLEHRYTLLRLDKKDVVQKYNIDNSASTNVMRCGANRNNAATSPLNQP